MTMVDHHDNDEEKSDDFPSYPALSTRMTTKTLHKVILKAKDDKEQRQAIKEIGLGHLLDLDIVKLPLQLGYWVIENFDVAQMSLRLPNNRVLHMDEVDVEMAIGLPRGHIQIDLSKKVEESEELNIFKDFWRACHSNGAKVVTTKIGDDLVSKKVTINMFKISFVVLCVNAFIQSNKNMFCDQSILPHLRDVNNIRNINFCKMVMDVLRARVKEWKTKKSSQFAGPFLVLVLSYMTRMQFEGKQYVPLQVPFFKGWTSSILLKCQKDELQGGGFGLAYVDERVENLIKKHKHTTLQQVKNIQPREKTNTEEKEPSQIANEEEKVFLKNMIQKTKNLLQALGEYEEVLNIASVKYGNNPYAVALKQATTKLLNTYSEDIQQEDTCVPQYTGPEAAQPEDDVFWTEVFKVTDEAATAKQRRKQQQGNNTEPEAQFTTYKPSPTLNPKTDNAQEMTKVKQPHKAQSSRNEKLDDMPTFDLGLDLSQHDRTRGKLPTTLFEKGKQIEDSLKETTNNLTQVFSRRELTMSQKMKSPYVNRVLDATKALTQDEKKISKWINSKELQNELLFQYKNFQVERKYFKSLLQKGEYIADIIVDVWAAVLNHKEIYRNEDSPTRYFVTTYPCKHLVWEDESKAVKDGSKADLCYRRFKNGMNAELEDYNINLKNINLVFFPIYHEKHFYLVCFNLKFSNCHIIDNLETNLTIRKRYGLAIPNLINFFSRYLIEKGHPRGFIVRKMKAELMKMPWRNDVNVVDCVIYTMRHMETYMGNGVKGWECGLKKDNFKSLENLRTRYCLDILDFEHNELKGSIEKAKASQ